MVPGALNFVSAVGLPSDAGWVCSELVGVKSPHGEFTHRACWYPVDNTYTHKHAHTNPCEPRGSGVN